MNLWKCGNGSGRIGGVGVASWVGGMGTFRCGDDERG
jgi:hypothetical protein